MAVFQDDLIRSYRAFLDKRRATRPAEEYREPTEEEWQEFQQHFQLRKVALGDLRTPLRLLLPARTRLPALRDAAGLARSNGPPRGDHPQPRRAHHRSTDERLARRSPRTPGQPRQPPNENSPASTEASNATPHRTHRPRHANRQPPPMTAAMPPLHQIFNSRQNTNKISPENGLRAYLLQQGSHDTRGLTAKPSTACRWAKIGRIIDALRHERYRFKPVQRLHSQEEREEKAARPAVVVGQTCRRSDPPPS